MKPSDFAEVFPKGSVLGTCENEDVAMNIMWVLSESGDVFREMTWEQYLAARVEHGSDIDTVTAMERSRFVTVSKYCFSEEMARKFSPSWAAV